MVREQIHLSVISADDDRDICETEDIFGDLLNAVRNPQHCGYLAGFALVAAAPNTMSAHTNAHRQHCRMLVSKHSMTHSFGKMVNRLPVSS